MPSLKDSPIVPVLEKIIVGIGFLTPLLDLAIRVWVARIFWNSGMQKTQSWASTLELFQWEYTVPLLPYSLAAYLATGIELVAPVLLVLGLGARVGALSLFILNWVAVISYPDISIGGFKDHLLWGTLLAVTFFHGPGKISLDYYIRRKFFATDA